MQPSLTEVIIAPGSVLNGERPKSSGSERALTQRSSVCSATVKR